MINKEHKERQVTQDSVRDLYQSLNEIDPEEIKAFSRAISLDLDHINPEVQLPTDPEQLSLLYIGDNRIKQLQKDDPDCREIIKWLTRPNGFIWTDPYLKKFAKNCKMHQGVLHKGDPANGIIIAP